jgi:thiol:disulfide interchange protein
LSLLAWIYGRWGNKSIVVPSVVLVLGALCFLCVLDLSVKWRGSATTTSAAAGTTGAHDDWQPWTQEAVDATLAKGQPVFVDFTAAWCLSCKVNERVALGTDAVKKAFADKNVALFRADWTHSDPEISKALQRFNRDGVPLYLLYSPKEKEKPQVLPAVLTPGIVLDAVGKL